MTLRVFFANDIFGSIDANRGDPQLGWDTDQFPIDLQETVLVLYLILKHGGFTSGGFNFDAKLRRQSIDLEDLFYAHISGIDTLARGLLIAAEIIENDKLKTAKENRYQDWQHPINADMLAGQFDFETIAQQAIDNNLDPTPISGQQELLERWMSDSVIS